ncbi:MAG: type II toxin-antitoxin system mRNA interferase toxin, RelE/StbE family [Gammaproteobacteria bacterium]|nr:type II toxin-antitoxin system mRNA interferase toxin, RelE/StbE family [Gammaproteobacteria bacterium]
MWEIYEKKSLLKTLKKVPKTILKHYELWKRIVELEGPSGLKQIKGFHDERLKGEWVGYRSSRISQQWRVIYQVDQGCCSVYVVEVNPHNYKRRK